MIGFLNLLDAGVKLISYVRANEVLSSPKLDASLVGRSSGSSCFSPCLEVIREDKMFMPSPRTSPSQHSPTAKKLTKWIMDMEMYLVTGAFSKAKQAYNKASEADAEAKASRNASKIQKASAKLEVARSKYEKVHAEHKHWSSMAATLA
eukprot:gene1486-32871_t